MFCRLLLSIAHCFCFLKNTRIVCIFRDGEFAGKSNDCGFTALVGAIHESPANRLWNGGAMCRSALELFESVGEGLRALPQQIKTTREGMEPLPYIGLYDYRESVVECGTDESVPLRCHRALTRLFFRQNIYENILTKPCIYVILYFTISNIKFIFTKPTGADLPLWVFAVKKRGERL